MSLNGPAFLVLFAVFIFIILAALAVVKYNLDKTDSYPLPAIPPQVDPYEVAYLRGGINEVARSVIFSLVQKGTVQIDTNRVTKTSNGLDARTLAELERDTLSWIGGGRDISEVFASGNGLTSMLEMYDERYCQNLLQRNFLMPPSLSSKARKLGYAAIAVIVAIGGLKVIAAFSNGRTNFLFLLAMIGIGSVLVGGISSMPRLTKLGTRYIKRLQNAFEDLKYRSQTPYIGKLTMPEPMPTSAMDPLLLSVGVFGTGILAGTMFTDYNDAFAKAHKNAANTSGCGSGCGSSCGSGCGSGCGGGCGGCS